MWVESDVCTGHASKIQHDPWYVEGEGNEGATRRVEPKARRLRMRQIWILNVVACVALAVAGSALALIALVRGAMFNASGHGSSLPVEMFAAPMGVGIAVWPLSFAAIGLPRRWLIVAIIGVTALVLAHGLGAWYVYTHTEYMSYFRKLWDTPLYRNQIVTYGACVAVLDLVSPVCILVRVVVPRTKLGRTVMRQLGLLPVGKENAGEKPIEMRP